MRLDDKIFFTKKLLEWFAGHHRPLPWKGERDPYKIWLSEIILQQTRVEQGMPYYEKFVRAYPTVSDLANAPEDAVLKLWEGLGYYTRARNLHAAARHIALERGGRFPDTYEDIRALRGVGDYTAAAIASFAYNLPYAVVDGNVYRVLARFFGLDMPTDTPAAKRFFAELAQELLDKQRPADFNQAIMDFGATQCTPAQPKCADCPLAPRCAALAQNRVQELPVRAKAAPKRQRFFLYAVFNHGHDVFLQQRQARDIWHKLYEFPLLELPALPAGSAEAAALVRDHFFPGAHPPALEIIGGSPLYRQTLSHQQIIAFFVEIRILEKIENSVFQHFPFADWVRMPRYDIKKNVAVPRLIDRFLQENAVTL